MADSHTHETYIIEGADLVLPDCILLHAALAVREGKIAHIQASGRSADIAKKDPAFAGASVLHMPDSYVMPALVETHIHGCSEWGFEKLAGPEDLVAAAAFLKQKGVGCFVPTLLWDEEAVASLALAIERCGLPEYTLPGLYLEGPFVNKARRGGIHPERIHAPEPDFARKIVEAAGGHLKIVTLAPERNGIEAVYRIFQEAGALVSLGHSDARLPAAKLPAHPYSITHLFNAMTGVDHKEGGLANLAFSGDPDFVELNGDGIHVNATCLRLAARAVSADSLVLISDAVISAGMVHGSYRYYGHEVISSERGVRYADTDVLMGSNRLGIDIVRNFVEQAQVPLWQAVRAMSLTPRKALGQAEEYGSLEVGKFADIFLWDKDLEIPVRPETLLARTDLRAE